MSDYKDALRRGLDAQAKLEQSKKDVAQVLDEVSKELADMLGQGVRFRLGKENRTVEGYRTKFGEAIGLLPSKSDKEVWVIEVYKSQATLSTTTSLADIEFAEMGYPISLMWPDHSLYVNGQKDLGPAISELLSSRHAGEKLAPLIASSK